MSKYILTQEDIVEVLKTAFEAGWSGNKDLEESVIQELVLSLNSKIKNDTTTNYDYVGFGTDFGTTITGMWTGSTTTSTS